MPCVSDAVAWRPMLSSLYMTLKALGAAHDVLRISQDVLEAKPG